MSPLKPLILASASLFLALAPATAQSPGQRILIEQSGGAPRQEGQVRIQTSINFLVAGPTGEGEDAQKLRDRARRTIYEMAARECDLPVRHSRLGPLVETSGPTAVRRAPRHGLRCD